MRHTKIRLMIAVMAMLVLISGGMWSQASAEPPLAVADGTKVTLEYTLALPDKTVVESNIGQEPVSYLHGNREILPGLEKALTGMKAGEKKHVTVAAEEAYGLYDEKKKVTVKKEQLPPNVQIGTRLRSPEGQEAKVVAIEGNSVVVDTNHPLAGKTLVFDINVLKVEKQPNAAK